MSEFAQVSSVVGNKVKVKMYKNEACKHCNACDFGAGGKEIEIFAINDCGAVAGDTVELFIKKDKFLKAVLIMYVIPLMALIGGLGFGYLLDFALSSTTDLFPVVFGFLFTFLAFLSIKKYNKERIERKYTPTAVRVIK